MFSKAFTKTIIFYLFLIFLSQLAFKAPSVKAYGGLANVAQAPVVKKIEAYGGLAKHSDSEHKVMCVFLANNFDLAAMTVCKLYK